MYQHSDDKVDDILKKYKMVDFFNLTKRFFNYTDDELDIVNRYISLTDFLAHNYDMNKTEVRAMLAILFVTTNPINLIPGSLNLNNLRHGFRTRPKYEIISYINKQLSEHIELSPEVMMLIHANKYPLTSIPQPKSPREMFRKILMDICVYTFGSTSLQYKEECVKNISVNAKQYYFKGVHCISDQAIKNKLLLDLTAWQWYTQTVRTIAFNTNYNQAIKNLFS